MLELRWFEDIVQATNARQQGELESMVFGVATALVLLALLVIAQDGTGGQDAADRQEFERLCMLHPEWCEGAK